MNLYRKQLADMLRIMCAMAMLLLGFSHHVISPAAASAQQEDLSAYRLPDGSLPVLCLPRDGDQDRGQDGGSSGCEACRLSTSVTLPGPAGSFAGLMPASHRTIRFAADSQHLRSGVPPGSSGPRAPPAAILL
jgi:hypothetical protein